MTENSAEYHHIIPLSWGGTNDINNFLPLCYEHHMIVHGVRARKSFVKGEYSRQGRPRKLPENYKEILNLYVNCKIGRRECKELLGISEKVALSDRGWYREYLEEKGIEKCKNAVDVVAANGVLKDGAVVGWIKYKGKRMQGCLWETNFLGKVLQNSNIEVAT